MKKEWFMFMVCALLTTVAILLLLRWFAPQLLGIPVDLQLVRVAEEVPPFFDGVFRIADYKTKDFIIKDPYVIRAKPLYPDVGNMGPNDILGFRNRFIPNVADIITIGDSQTYGNHTVLEKNWPSQLESSLANKSSELYSMAVGGWSAPEYYDIFYKSLVFDPRVVIVAFYTGNDPLESFMRVYGNKQWAFFRPNPNISASDAPKVKYPPPKSEWWKAVFNDGSITFFTPKVRHASNRDHPAVHAGYAIMAEVARQISASAQKLNIKIVFAIIPTKELVYAKKIQGDGLAPPAEYLKLVRDEQKNLLSLASQIGQIPHTIYVDLLKPLQNAALKSTPLYPRSDGHPLQTGHEVIAKALAPAIERLLPLRPQGGILLKYGPKQSHRIFPESYIQIETLTQYVPKIIDRIFLVRDNQLWRFSSLKVFTQNGWKVEYLRGVKPRDIANLSYAGIIHKVDPEKFGPVEKKKN
jgi:hypothetical protein